MSDVSKTNELIEEARRQVGHIEDKSKRERLIADLADALEAKTGIRVDMSSAVGVETQLAATRVPVQGEPNDDRAMQIAQALAKAHTFTAASAISIANAALALAVPDAATEGDYHEGLEEGIKIGRAERDAALAAIGRVRAVLANDELVWSDGSYTNDLVVEVKDIIAALDGAPEPETPELFPGTNAALDRLTVRKAAPAEAFCIEHGNFHAVELGDPTCEFEDGFGLPVEGEQP